MVVCNLCYIAASAVASFTARFPDEPVLPVAGDLYP
jgi:hypothetical protein